MPPSIPVTGAVALALTAIAFAATRLFYMRRIAQSSDENSKLVTELQNLRASLSPVEYGYREEWKAFAARHTEFTRRFVNIGKAVDVAFQRIHKTTTPTERTIYFLGRLAVEDFMEMFLLCANGYGIGAQKLIRGMYERAVTARYLYKYPEETDNYLAFHRVTDHKLMIAIQSSPIGGDVFPPEKVEKIKREFETVKARFMISDCKVCKTIRLNHTWTKVDVVSMARMADKNLSLMVVPAYIVPTREFHSTLGAIFSRLDPEAAARNEGLLFDGAAQRDRADQSLITGCNLLLNVLDLQREVFHIQELEPLLQICFEDFRALLKEQKERDARLAQTK